VVIVLGLAVVVVVYVWLRRQGQAAQELQALRRFRYRQAWSEERGNDWDFDLVEMILRVTSFDYSFLSAGNPRPAPSFYTVRRRDGGSWEAQMTAESRATNRAELLKEMERPALVASWREEKEAQLRAFDEAPTWTPVPDNIAAPLESQYQRFVRQYRR
jgi:hypothetical protein